MRHVCLVIVDRANWGRISPVARAIQKSPSLRLSIVCAGSTVLSRFACPADDIEQAGFPVVERLWHCVEGGTPETMARSLGLGVIEFAGAFERLNPDIVLLIGDRSEALAAAIAAAYSNRCLVHLQGGEISGSIDESARHAISKLAHFHVPATQQAADNLVRMGERPESILTVGCPSSDIAREIRESPPLVEPYLLAVFHPTTTQYGSERGEMRELLDALCELEKPTRLWWPNVDAGSDSISKEIRRFIAEKQPTWLETVKNVPPEEYARLLAGAACCVGNSSSFVRDSGFYGCPVVLVGDRQAGRECSENVIRVEAVAADIAGAVRAQLENGRYVPSSLYGDGRVSERVAAALERLEPYTQKRLAYAMEAGTRTGAWARANSDVVCTVSGDGWE